MAEIKGMGICLIPNDEGIPCAGQIEEGASIGTVMLTSGPAVGHKSCAGGFYARKMQIERNKREEMVKIAKQGGPGGAVDMSTAEDAVMNPTSLVKPEIETSEIKPELRAGALVQPASEPHELTDSEREAVEAYKQKLLGARVGMVTEEVAKALTQAEHALASLRQVTIKLMDAYDKVVTERDQARSERDTAKATTS